MAAHRLTAQDRRRQIMDVAMKLFARQGFEGTTTRRIAERAKVNEAIIFRHFPRKEDLYWAIIEDHCEAVRAHGKLEEMFREGSDDRKLFAALAETLLHRNKKDDRLGRLLLFSALEKRGLSRRFFQTHIAEYYEVLATHIGKRIREGSFRRMDPVLAARGFLGMVIYHFLVQELFGGKRYQRFDSRRVAETFTDIWLQGMRARNGGRKHQESHKRT